MSHPDPPPRGSLPVHQSLREGHRRAGPGRSPICRLGPCRVAPKSCPFNGHRKCQGFAPSPDSLGERLALVDKGVNQGGSEPPDW